MKRYIRASFNNDSMPSWLKQDKGALDALNRAGIDLANCQFSETRQGKIGDNYVVYHITGTRYGSERYPFVWIPGLYNDNNYVTGPKEYSYRAQRSVSTSKAIRYMAKKDLTYDNIVYVNVGDNKKAAKEHYKDPRYDSYGKYAGQYYTPEKTDVWNPETRKWDATVPAHWSEGGLDSWREKRDKSGYIIPDPKERLRKFHETEEGQTRQAQKASKELEIIFGQLINLKDRLTEDFNANAGSLDTFGKNMPSLKYLKEAIDEYKHALACITVKSYNGKDYYVDPEGALEYVEQAKRSIRYAEKSLETGITYSSNW